MNSDPEFAADAVRVDSRLEYCHALSAPSHVPSPLRGIICDDVVRSWLESGSVTFGLVSNNRWMCGWLLSRGRGEYLGTE